MTGQPTMTELPDGLSKAEVAARLAKGEVNRVRTHTSRSFCAIVRANVFTRFNALLGSLCAVVLAVGPWQDALFGGVLITNSLIGIVQEWRAKRQLDRLALLHQPRARVPRGADGRDPPGRHREGRPDRDWTGRPDSRRWRRLRGERA